MTTELRTARCLPRSKEHEGRRSWATSRSRRPSTRRRSTKSATTERHRAWITADQISTRGGQQRLYDITTFNSWAQAEFSGEDKLAEVFVRRFRPEYMVAFRAWMKLHPLTNPKAPPGPVFMPEYHNALDEQAAKMQAQASAIFDAGTRARETGDDYVRTTVFLATVLFVIALGQRFKVRAVRLTLLGTAGVFLAFALFSLSTYPHI